MIRCKCGTWTDFGMTCVACRSETYRNMRPPTSKNAEGVEENIEIEEEPWENTDEWYEEEPEED